ncbi:DUF4330 family protein [Halostagnicola sp. A-GB9-2]|uniref:DUF4330 family protein n=1 Tax=Halostagnicola sp. A-GB9-2 TaxID=3048066 RepID=UPI0024BF5F6E|nr:DUF4330 family protein [Halostagnicola sp. A-GB9-2]MDJ1431967.1 DUF4330 family protein [Halostagnicola sp. A-GB9-2]
MTVIDEDGNLFGVVNVVDALAIVLVLAVLVAGVAVVGVLGIGDSSEPDESSIDPDEDLETRHVTIDLGDQSEYVVDRINEGDTVTHEDSPHNLTITDVYVTPNLSNNVEPTVTIRTEINGELTDSDDDSSNIQYAGEELRVGTDLQLATAEYTTQGEVTDVDFDNPALETDTTPVLLETTVDDRTAAELESGDTVALGPHETATVTAVDLYPTGGDQYRAFVGAELETLTEGTTPTYGTQPVTIGTQLTLQTDAYDLEGEIRQRGTDEQAGEPTTTRATIELDSVSPNVDESLEVGQTETVRGETFATVESVRSEPAEVVLESDDGNIHLREHPTNRDVTLEVELRTLETDTGVRFHGDQLRENESITLEFNRIDVNGTVTEFE